MTQCISFKWLIFYIILEIGLEVPRLSLLLMSHRIINYVEGVLQKLIQFNPLFRKGLFRSGSWGPRLVKSWTPPRTEVPQPLWASWQKKKKINKLSYHGTPLKTYSSSVCVFSDQRGPGSNKISLSPSLLQAEWAHFFQPLLMHHVLQPLDLHWAHSSMSISFQYWGAQS